MTEPTTDPGAGARDVLMAVCWNPGTVNTILAALADAGYVIVAQRYRSVTVTHDLLYPGKTIIGSVTVDGVRLEADLSARPDGAR
jgi:hypothetical protein